MNAVLLTGHGGLENLVYRKDVRIPEIKENHILLKVLSCGVNNTDLNLRIGWYSKKNTKSTSDSVADVKVDGGWNSHVKFPLIQGTDCCGRVVKIGSEVKKTNVQVGDRVLVRPCQGGVWMGSDYDGAFAEYVCVPHTEVFHVRTKLTDIELGAIPCAFATAENMLHRACVTKSDHVLVPGASGGVGLAVVLLAIRRGARVTAISSKSKIDMLRKIISSPSRVLSGRSGSKEWSELCKQLKKEDDVTVVVDNVGGDGFADLLEIVTRHGRYVTSGAIAGPIVKLDLRTLYLRDIQLIGSTAWDPCVFPNLIKYIENKEIKPIIHKNVSVE